jgi:hypothetical protein
MDFEFLEILIKNIKKFELKIIFILIFENKLINFILLPGTGIFPKFG